MSLAGIRSDNVTLQWTTLEKGQKGVYKYLIQVNGVNVGDTGRLENSITVTGLKPAHFYNVRVIAVGSNNFQAGSRVIRLRTYNRDGRPELGGGNSGALYEATNGGLADNSDDAAKMQGVAIEPATSMPDGISALVREGASLAGSRRNTVARRHSPSSASEHPSLPTASDIPEGSQSMQDLTQRFETIRKDTEDVISQMAREKEETERQMEVLSKERDERRKELRSKEEASEKLRKEVNASEKQNRQSQMRRAAKEKVLHEKQAGRDKMMADIQKWAGDIEIMRKERKEWEQEKDKIAKETSEKVEEMKGNLRKRQNSLSTLEEEIRVKGLQIQELQEERKKLPGGGGDEESEESKAAEARERAKDAQYDARMSELTAKYHAQNITLQNLEREMQKAQAQMHILSSRQPLVNPLMYHGNTSAAALSVDYDNSGHQRPKQRRNRQRKSRTNTISSPNPPVYPQDQQQQQPMNTYPHANPYAMSQGLAQQHQDPSPIPTFAQPTFAPGPYFDPNITNSGISSPDHTGLTEAEINAFTAGAPLSPTATNLLPSNIFADDDPPENRSFGGGFQSMDFGGGIMNRPPPGFDNLSINDPKYSPDSSSRSASMVSSPLASQRDLSMIGPSGSRDSWHENDRHLLGSRHSTGGAFGVIGSPSSENVSLSHGISQDPSQPSNTLVNSLSTKRFGDIFSFSRETKARSKTLAGDAPALGSLKSGQSQSFPKQIDDGSEPQLAKDMKTRRTSFTTGWDKIPFLNRSPATAGAGSSALNGTIPEGSSPAPMRGMTSLTAAARRRGFNMFGSSMDDPSALMVDRSPGSPRPASIASSDLPRPSTDSAPFGWAPSNDLGLLNRNSPLATNWSVNPGHGMQTSGQTWGSRVGSRRPSIIQQTSGLREGIASDDDEFLPDGVLDSPLVAVGVIGTRPASQMSGGSKKVDLNPKAETFKAISQSVFGRKKDKKEDTNEEKKDKADKPAKKSKKERKAEKAFEAAKPKTQDEAEEFMTGSSSYNKDFDNSMTSWDSHSHASSFFDHQRPRESRDGQSIKTLNSVTESYDSLENAMTSSDHGLYSSLSHKSADHPGLATSVGSVGRGENSFQKLLRKGSSSKFSIASFRNIGGGKKPATERSESRDRSSGVDEMEGSREDLMPSQAPTSSPMVTQGEDKDGGKGKGREAERSVAASRESRMSVNWGRFVPKGKKGRTSGEIERSTEGKDKEGGVKEDKGKWKEVAMSETDETSGDEKA